MSARAGWLALLVHPWLSACLFANPEFSSEGAASQGGTGTGTSGATGGPGSTGASASATSSGASTTGTSAVVTVTEAATTGGTAVDGTGADATGTGATTGTIPTVRLQHYVDGQCDQPFWCYDQGLLDGTPARMFAHECFTGLTPPVHIVRVASVAATRLSPTAPMIELRGFDGASPGASLLAPVVALAPGDVEPGYHEVAVDYTVEVESLCIGVVGGDQPQGTALGIAVDDGPPPPLRSFFRVDGVFPCDSSMQFKDIDNPDLFPRGRWCIAADIESAG